MVVHRMSPWHSFPLYFKHERIIFRFYHFAKTKNSLQSLCSLTVIQAENLSSKNVVVLNSRVGGGGQREGSSSDKASGGVGTGAEDKIGME